MMALFVEVPGKTPRLIMKENLADLQYARTATAYPDRSEVRLSK